MTSFTDLCKAYAAATEKYTLYQAECEKLAEAIYQHFQQAHDIPASQIGIYIFDGNGDNEKFNGPLGSALRLQDDSYFEFGIGITLYVNENELPWETVVIPVRVSQDSDKRYHAKTGDDGKDFIIHSAEDTAAVGAFTEHVLSALVEEYEEGLTRMIDQHTIRKLGFTVGKNEGKTT